MTELVLTFIVFGGLGLVMLFMSKLLGPRKKSSAKDRPFECGSPYLQSCIPPVSIPFALVALIFLLFDVEIVFFFPWALVLRRIRVPGFLGICAFLIILAPGFLYAWKKGVLDWE